MRQYIAKGQHLSILPRDDHPTIMVCSFGFVEMVL